MKKEVLAPICASLVLGVVLEVTEMSTMPGWSGPDFLLALSCAVGWVSPMGVSAVSGFLIGLLRDVSSGRIFGLEALCMMLSSLLVVFLRRFLSPDGVLSRSMAAFFASIAARTAGFLIIRIMGLALSPTFFLKEILLYDVLWASLLVWPCQAILSWLIKKLSGFFPKENQRQSLEYGRW